MRILIAMPIFNAVCRPSLPLVAASVVLLCGGCAALPLALIGSVTGLAASAVSTGNSVYKLGKLDTVESVHYEDAREAVRRTAADMLMFVNQDEEVDGKWRFLLVDDDGSETDIVLDRRTDVLVRIRIDVGLFGSEPTARLILDKLRGNLPPAPPTTHPTLTPPAVPPERLVEPTTGAA